MSERHTIFPALTLKQLNRISRCFCPRSGNSLLDVGCGDGVWIHSLQKRGGKVAGLNDPGERAGGRPAGETEADGLVRTGSPAASIPFSVHSFNVVLLRGISLFEQPKETPEVTIALANLLSCLKPKGGLVIPLAGPEEETALLWKQRLRPFPVQGRLRVLSGGVAELLKPAWLFGRIGPVTVLEFRIGRKRISRLEWHRLAREGVLRRQQKPPAAA